MGLIVSLLFTALYVRRPAILVFLDHKVYDTLLRSNVDGETPDGVVIVDVDETSLAAFGQWPWPRSLTALLLDKLRRLGAASVGVDVMFSEPERSFSETPEIARDLWQTAGFGDPPGASLTNDQILAGILRHGPFVLGYVFLFESGGPLDSHCHLHPVNAVLQRGPDVPENPLPLHSADDVVCNLGELSEAVQTSGFLNAAPDADGILRRVPQLIEHRGKLYPSLALATVMRAFGAGQMALKVTRAGVESLRLRDTEIPLDAGGNLLVRYRGKRRTIPYISAADILNDRLPAKGLQGKIVLVGTSASGLEQGFATPVGPVFPGVEIHATVIANLLKKDFVRRPPHMPGFEICAVFGAGLMSTLILVWMRPWRGALVLALGAAGLWQASDWVFRTRSLYASPLLPLLTVACNFAVLTLAKFLLEEKKARQRSKDLMVTQNLMLASLTSLAETWGYQPGKHILRTQRYVKALCQGLSERPKYRKLLDESTVELLSRLAPLHDIGKVRVPEGLLLKSGKLSEAELAVIRKHAAYGRDIIERAEASTAVSHDALLTMARDLVYTHHERWDGTGYPEGLSGTNIPLPGRVMAIVDVYEALVSSRVYRRPFSHAEAVRIISDGRGTQFDPDMVDAFFAIQEEWRRVALELFENEEEKELFARSGNADSKRA